LILEDVFAKLRQQFAQQKRALVKYWAGSRSEVRAAALAPVAG